ncbi:unnamed protein product [Chrysoparadoxa australica]
MRIALLAAASVLGLTACTSDRVEFGGIASPLALNGPAIDCSAANVVLTERGTLTFPRALLDAAYFSQNREGFRVNVPFTFDITPEGEVVNAVFAGDPDMTRSRSRRDAIKFGAEWLLSSQYEWPRGNNGEYARGCTETVNFSSRFATQA